MSNTEEQTVDKKLDTLWEENKTNSKKTDELGSFVDIDNDTIRNAGIKKGNLTSPGNFKTWKNSPSTGRYFMEGYGAGITRLFKK